MHINHQVQWANHCLLSPPAEEMSAQIAIDILYCTWIKMYALISISVSASHPALAERGLITEETQHILGLSRNTSLTIWPSYFDGLVIYKT